MVKELYLYSPISSYVAEYLISQMEENKISDIVLRGNTPGGNVFMGWGIIGKMKEIPGKVTMKVDGFVASMGTNILIFSDDSEALDVSRIHLHRADAEVNTPEEQEFLNGINKDIRSKLAMKVNEAKLKELKGVTLDDIFDPAKRVELWLTAYEAKEIGLINRIVKLDPLQITAMEQRFMIAAQLTPESLNSNKNLQTKNKPMKPEELKAQHPETYAQIYSEGRNAGSTEERERVRGWEAFRIIDADAVNKGIKEGKVISPTDFAEFTAKALSPETLKKIVAGNAPGVQTGEVPKDDAPKTEADKELSDLEASVSNILNLNKPKKV
jgi:ATP-dependent protease ClpP protease subunit